MPKARDLLQPSIVGGRLKPFEGVNVQRFTNALSQFQSDPGDRLEQGRRISGPFR